LGLHLQNPPEKLPLNAKQGQNKKKEQRRFYE